MKKVLIIQTAFIGDVILATALIESIHQKNPSFKIDFLVRKGNESLLHEHPKLNDVLVWDKGKNKRANLKSLAKNIKAKEYDIILNLQRFASTGFLCWKSKAKLIVGFKKNPFSFSYSNKIEHKINNGMHEVERNHQLLLSIDTYELSHPRLYPLASYQDMAEKLKGNKDIVVMAPASVWFTKQLPKIKWLELIASQEEKKIILIGGKTDVTYLNEIVNESLSKNIVNMAGRLSLLESAALIQKASMSFVNDSAPLHLASAMNAPVTAFFCSTIPSFGFGPLSENQKIVEIDEKLECKPCGLHGKKSCPKSHFKCGLSIDVTKF